MDNHELWQSVLIELENSLSRANFGMWFRDTFIAEDTGETITIGVPNSFYLDWIKNKYHKNIADCLRKQRPEIRDISYKVAAQKPVALTEAGPLPLGPIETVEAPTKKSQLSPFGEDQFQTAFTKNDQGAVNAPYAVTHGTGASPTNTQEGNSLTQNPLDPTRTFESFIVGNSNRLAHAVSLAAAAEPGHKYNPLFLYGGVGLGKTHLAQAIGNSVRKQQPNAKITYVSSEMFTNEFIDALRKNQMDAFKRRYRQSDVLLIDDVQFMSGKTGIQEEFFHTFNALHQNKKQIVLTADQEPQNIKGLEERLTSRFAWGMVADIQAPDFETRLAILREKCAEFKYNIPVEVLETVAQVIQSNIRELEGGLQRLITQSQIENMPLTPEYAQRVFAAVAMATRSRSLNGNKIVQVVCEFFELKSEDVIGPRRYKELVYPRQLAMYLLRHELNYSYPQIGKELGGKDHTTIMHGVGKIEKEIARNTNMQYDLGKLKEKIHQSM